MIVKEEKRKKVGEILCVTRFCLILLYIHNVLNNVNGPHYEKICFRLSNSIEHNGLLNTEI